MPMPKHDPNRFVEAVLADPSHKLPLSDRGGRLFPAGGETVDRHHPFYAALLADGSLRLKPAATSSEAAAASEPPAPPAEAPAAADQP